MNHTVSKSLTVKKAFNFVTSEMIKATLMISHHWIDLFEFKAVIKNHSQIFGMSMRIPS